MIYDFKKKETNVKQLNNYMLAKTLSMFEWQDLPETIPHRELEKLLQVNGYAFITKVEGDLYAFAGSIGGETDPYGNATQITINNVALKFNKTLSIKDDGVLIFNDDMAIGLMPLFQKHNTQLIESDINMMLHGYNTRVNTLISASDDKTKDNATAYLKKIIDGEIGVIGENALFDGVRVQSASGITGNNITAMTEYHQYIKASLFNEIGLSANFNMKRERLTSGEVSQGEDSLFPYVYNMLKCRNQAVEALKTMYELDLKVAFGSVWHIKEIEMIDDIITNDTLEDISNNDKLDEPLNEPLNEPLDESLDTPLDESLEKALDSVDDVVIEPDVKDVEDAKTIDELMSMLENEDLSDDDIKAIEDLIKEIEDKDDGK